MGISLQKIFPMKNALPKKRKETPDKNQESEKELKQLISKKKAESNALRKILEAMENNRIDKSSEKK